MLFVATFAFTSNSIFANFNFNFSFLFLLLFLFLMHYLCSIYYFSKYIFFFVQLILGFFIFFFLHVYEKHHHLLPRLGMVDNICMIHVWLQQLVLGLRHLHPDHFHADEIFGFICCCLLTMFDHFFYYFPNHCY